MRNSLPCLAACDRQQQQSGRAVRPHLGGGSRVIRPLTLVVAFSLPLPHWEDARCQVAVNYRLSVRCCEILPKFRKVPGSRWVRAGGACTVGIAAGPVGFSRPDSSIAHQ
jgi:hypothetical protein